jgi:hypothetical protein
MVIGPTPPGTGVMALATSLTSSKQTSPTSLEPFGMGGIIDAVDTHVDHDCAGFHPVAAYHLRPSDCPNQHICRPAYAWQILGA